MLKKRQCFGKRKNERQRCIYWVLPLTNIQFLRRPLQSRSCGLSTRGRGFYKADKPPVFVLIDCGTGQRYVIPAKAVDESTVRLLLAVRQHESLTIYTDGFRAYDPF